MDARKEDIITMKVWTTKQVASVVGFAIVITFSATMIWSRFIYNEAQLQVVDDRYKKITTRILEDNKNQWQVINELQQKGD